MKTATAPQPQTVYQELPDEGRLLDEVLERSSSKLDSIASRYSQALRETEGHLRRAMLLASGIDRLREALAPNSDLMKRIMSLMNSPLGFMTDRGPGMKNSTPYPVETVRDCVISALLQGVYPVGNEFNIIAGRCYIAQAGYRRLVCESPGVTDVVLAPGVPYTREGRTIVRVAGTWRLHGQPQQLMDGDGKPGLTFAIVAYENSTADNVVGKAKRKAYKAMFEIINGTDHAPWDGEIEDETGVPPGQPANGRSKTEQLAARLGGNGARQEEQPAPEPVNQAQESEIQMLLADLSVRIREAESTRALEDVGRDVDRSVEAIGQERYASLLAAYRRRYAELTKKQRQPGDEPE